MHLTMAAAAAACGWALLCAQWPRRGGGASMELAVVVAAKSALGEYRCSFARSKSAREGTRSRRRRCLVNSKLLSSLEAQSPIISTSRWTTTVALAASMSSPHRECPFKQLTRIPRSFRLNGSNSDESDNSPINGKDSKAKSDNFDIDVNQDSSGTVNSEIAKEQQQQEQLKAETMQWVRNVVVGLNLCPFAEKPLLQQRLRIVVVESSNSDKYDSHDEQQLQGDGAFAGGRSSEDQDRATIAASSATTEMSMSYENMVVSTVEREGERLLTTPGTTLVVCPDFSPTDFEEFMAVVQTVERLITKRNWDGLLQVAPFHPQFQFAGSSSANDPDNRTNQSPHPMIHILREDDVSRAVEQLPNQDAAVVWSRNVDVLNELADTLEPSDFDTVMTRGIQGLPKFVPPQPATSSSTSMANQTVDMSTGDNNVRSLVRQILGRFRTPLLSTTKERNDSAETQQ